MTPIGPTLQTSRLVLRPPAPEDFEPWAALMADAEAARWIGGATPRSVAWRSMASVAGAWALYGVSMFSVIEVASGRWIGRVGPWFPAEWPGPEVGWGLVKDVWGRGLATEAAVAAMDWAFEDFGWTEVIHTIAPENAASIRVAEKLGSARLGRAPLPAPYAATTVDLYGQSREQWRARRR